MANRTTQMPFAAGLDENTDAPLSAKLLRAINVRWAKVGALAKRYGWNSLPQTIVNPPGVGLVQPTTLASASKLLTFGDELDLVDANAQWLYSYSPSQSAFVTKDQTQEAVLTREAVAQGEQGSYSPDTAIIGNIQVTVWQTYDHVASNGLFVLGAICSTAVDLSDGSVIFEHVNVATSTSRSAPKLITGTLAGNAKFQVVYTDCAGSLYWSVLDATNVAGGWSGETLLANDMANYGGSPTQFAGAFDVVSNGTTSAWVLYEGTGAVPANLNLKHFTFGSSTLLGTAHPGDATLSPIFAVGLLYDSVGTCLIPAWASSTGTNATTKIAKYDTSSTPAQITAQTVVHTNPTTSANITYSLGVVRSDTPRASDYVVVTFGVGTQQRYSVVAANVTTFAVGGVGGSQNVESFSPLGGQPVSRPFTWGNQVYCFLWVRDTTASATFLTNQGTVVLANLNAQIATAGDLLATPRPVATGAPRLARSGGMSGSCLAHVVFTDANTAVTPIPISIYAAAVQQFTAHFAHADINEAAPAQQSIALTGGCPSLYDGAHVVESGYLFYPAISVALTTTGGTLGNGTYGVAVVYEWYDTVGQWHRSAPAFATFTTANATSYATIKVAQMSLTNRWKAQNGVRDKGNTPDSVFAIVYRTVANGATWYRSTPIAVPIGNNAGADALPITSTDGMVSITDQKTGDGTTNDVAFLAGLAPVLYTTAGDVRVLPPFCPPSARFVANHKNRLWLAGTDDGQSLWYSKQLEPHVAPEFNDGQQMVVTPDGVSGIASYGDALLVFTEDQVYALFGDGPNNLGQGFDYVFRSLSSDLGCIEANSIVAGADGVFFRSKRGIAMVSGDFSVSWIGRDVQDELPAAAKVTSAVIVASQHQVRFTVTNGGNGLCLVYDTLTKGWTIYAAGTLGAPMSGGVIWKGAYAWAHPVGAAFVESSTLYTDDGTWVTATVKTAWQKMAALQGFQRLVKVALLGEQVTAADLAIQPFVDFSTSGSAPFSFAAAPSLVGKPSTYVCRVPVQKCQALAVQISDATPTGGPAVGTGAGFTFHGLSFEFLGKPGVARVPAAQQG